MMGMMGRLRSLWNAPIAHPAPPKRVWRDWVLVAVLPLAAAFEGLVRTDLPNPLASVLVLVLIVPTLLWRRTHPLLMVIISFAVTSAFHLVTGHELDLYSSAFLLLLIYSVFRWGSGRAIIIGLGIMIVSAIASALEPPFGLSDLIAGFVFLALIALVGLLLRFGAASRVRELDRAKSDEREQLARDLHDTVAHHVSAIAIQAQAGLETVGTNPDAATAALRVIEAEASSTLAEMRSMVRVLRNDDAVELAPAAKIADLRRLGDERGRPIVDVQLIGDVEGISAPVGAAIYRIAQESVTNARRHARGATRIDVKVEVADERVHVTVHNDGSVGTAAAPGYGITGMTERATLLGGTCTAGRHSDGGWIVAADLPRAAAS